MAHDITGLEVEKVRKMTDEEMDRFGAPTDRLHGKPAVLELEDGTTIFPSADPEGNGYGALFAIDDDELFTFVPPE